MTPELRDLVVNFVGQTYGEMHKLDKDITQASNNLQPASTMLKAKATNIINSVLPQNNQPSFGQPVFNGSPHPQVDSGSPYRSQTDPDQLGSMQPLRYDPNQLEFNFKEPGVIENLLNSLKQIETTLQHIASNLDIVVEKLSN